MACVLCFKDEPRSRSRGGGGGGGGNGHGESDDDEGKDSNHDTLVFDSPLKTCATCRRARLQLLQRLTGLDRDCVGIIMSF